MILSETAFNTSLKDIGRRFNVSDKTVQRIIDEEAKMHKKSLPEHLPKHMAFDEFMSTDKMSFIWLDSDNHRTGDILPRRTSYQISKYFSRFPLKVRRQVKTISLDLNAGYINLVPKLFPKAKVVVDRFHIVQMMNRSLNSTRIQVMKRMPKRSKEYLFMKRDWKKFLESFDSIEKINPKYQYSVGYYETDLNLITKCLDLDEGFAKSYEVYQDILKAIREKNFFTDVIMITAANSTNEIKRAFAYGVVDYLVKPFEFERFKEAINKYKARKKVLLNEEVVSQSDIDSLIMNNSSENEVKLPKGLNARTLDRIIDFLNEKSNEVWTLREIAYEIKISNVTIKKYMDYLESIGKVDLEMNFGNVGRPEYKYFVKK